MSSSTNRRSLEPTRQCAPERRLNPFTGDWVIIAGNRAHRPQDLATEIDAARLSSCPFCAGRESETTAAIAELDPPRSASHGHAWQVRVVPNLYPAFISGPSGGDNSDPTLAAEASHGQHDVVIESPRHLTRLTELTDDEASVVFRAYQQRMLDYASDPQLVYGIIFKNCGSAAGMSREHIHAQMAGLPFIPPMIDRELTLSAQFHHENGRCLFCTTIEQEIADGKRVVHTTPRLVAICPFASRFPYETWILPRAHQASFESTPVDLMSELSALMLEILRQLESLVPCPAYNYIVHTSPFDTRWKDHYHWHIEVIPRLSRLAGLELGTGVHVNTVSPELAANRLRKLTSA